MSEIISLPRTEFAIREVRHLTNQDLDDWCRIGPARITTHKKLSARHRRIASMVARGYTNLRIAGFVGVSPQTVCNLKKNPAFLMFVEKELERITDEDQEHFETMVEVRDMATERLHERLAGDTITDPKELRQIALGFGDRTGHGPMTKHEEIHSVGAETLAHLRRQADEEDLTRTRKPRRYGGVKQTLSPEEEGRTSLFDSGVDDVEPVGETNSEGNDSITESRNALSEPLHEVSQAETQQ